jgi:polar amino acid transport system substrate-binding protein
MLIRHACVLLLAGLCSVAGAADKLTITTELAPPTSMLEMLTRVGVDFEISMLPWKRAYSAALTNPSTCVYSTTRTPEREHLFKWVGPTDEGDWVLMGVAGRKYNLRTLEDARNLRIGTQFGDARNDYLRAHGFETDAAHTDTINPQKLLLGRIDLWAASMRRGTTALAARGLAGKIVPVLVFNHIQVYLACNVSVPDALIERMNATLEAMARDGTSRRIDRKYENYVEPPAARGR